MAETVYQTCKDCEQDFPASGEYFRIDDRYTNGLRNQCIFCRREYMRERALKRQYGITVKEWNRIFIEQKGRCKICGVHQSELNRNLETDHNHETGEVRGLLCINCNTKLGWYENYQNEINKYFKGVK